MKRKRSQAQIAADKKRTGRPPKSKAEKQDRRVMVSLTKAEHAQLSALAKKAGLPLAVFLLRPWREEK